MENRMKYEILGGDTEVDEMNIKSEDTSEFVDKEIKMEVKEEDPLKLDNESLKGNFHLDVLVLILSIPQYFIFFMITIHKKQFSGFA